MLLSEAAYPKILWIRGEYAQAFPNNLPETFGVAIGQFISKDGEVAAPNVAIAFFRKSEVAER
jgi:hypothetical protein